MNVVLMGMPGVGKGTQAAMLKDALNVPHVSSGDILREAVRAGSSLGRKVRGLLDSGQLVPDDMMGDLIVNRLGQNDARGGFVLDGFPRTQPQVGILDRALNRLGGQLDAVFLLTAPEDEIVRRLSGRRVCPQCASVFHLEGNPSQSPGVCDGCGSALVQRQDDSEEVVRGRFEVYREQTLPIAQSYQARELLGEIDGIGEPQAVFGRLGQAVEQAS
jgi:adenylate kinase